MNFSALKFETSYGLGAQLPESTGREIVICGRSNVGKSTLLNKLASKKNLARVSSMPGKTTTINRFSLCDGVYIMDLPGYGYAKRPQQEIRRWARLLETFFTSGRNISLGILLLDCRRTIQSDDITMLQCFVNAGIPFFIVATKTDKLTPVKLAESLKSIKDGSLEYGPVEIVPFSQNGEDPAREVKRLIEGSLN